jgi:transposase
LGGTIDSFTVVVGNAEHLRGLRGRQTDVKDAEWIATLLAHGLMPGRFIPDRAQRELRELTRFRTAVIHDRARVANRLQKTLAGANSKLGAVLTDIVGASGQRILDALLRGATDLEAVVALAEVRILRPKREALEPALLGRLEGKLAFLVGHELPQIRLLDEQIAAGDDRIAEELRPFAAELARLDAMPGIGVRNAQVIIAEIGTDMSRSPSARHLAAWAGICPANKTSGGKRQRAGTRRGNPWLRQALVEAGWAHQSELPGGAVPPPVSPPGTETGGDRGRPFDSHHRVFPAQSWHHLPGLGR